MLDPRLDPDAAEKAALRRRLGIFLLGVAIGLVLLGAIQMAKRSMLAQPAPATGR